MPASDMESIEKSPLLSSKDLDDPIRENNSTGNPSKYLFVLGLFAALGWVSFSAVSAICVQVSGLVIKYFKMGSPIEAGDLVSQGYANFQQKYG